MSKFTTWDKIPKSDLTEQAIKEFKVGMSLTFDFEGSPNSYKIMRITKNNVFIKRTFLISKNELEKHRDHDVNFNRQPPYCKTCHMRLKG